MGQRGRLPVLALGYAKSTKVILGLPETAGVNFLLRPHTPNTNMADHSVGARDESIESEASWASMFCFDNAFPE